MMIFHNATIDVDKDSRKAYEFAPVLDEGESLQFPLGGVTVKHFGGRAEIMLPARPGEAGRVLDRYQAGEPVMTQTKGKSVYTLTGDSEMLYMAGVGAEQLTVTVTITEWSSEQGSVVVE